MIDHCWEDKMTDPFEIYVSREWIQQYSHLIGDHSPIYHDPKQAIEKGYQDIIAPLTFPIVFWQYTSIPWLENQGPFIHRDQTFHYNEPIMANRSYICQIRLQRLITKPHIQYLENELVGHNKSSTLGIPSFRAISTLILKGEENDRSSFII